MAAQEAKETKDVTAADPRPLVAVLPATGNCGIATVKALAARYSKEVRIRAIVRDAAKADAIRGLDGVEVVGGISLDNPASVQGALQGVSKVFFSAPTTQNRTDLVMSGANAAKAAGVKHIVILSVLGAEYEAITFGKQFRQLEKHVESLGLPWTFVRAPSFYENLLAQAQAVSNTYAFYGATGGNAQYTSVAVEDIGRAAAAVLATAGHENKAYDLVGGTHSDNQTAAFLTKALGYQVRYVDVGIEGVKQSLVGIGFPEWQISGVCELIQLQADGKAVSQSDDLAKLVGRPIRLDQWLQARAHLFKHADLPEDKKPLVTIITGNSNTGSAAVRALHDSFLGRVRVRAAVRSEDKAGALREMKGVEVFVGVDAEKPESVEAACAGASKVFIAPPNYREDRADIVIKMMDAAKAAGVQHIVLLSVFGAQYEAVEFGRQFRKMEKHAESLGVAYTHLRATYFMDNLLGSKDAITQQHAIHGSHGAGKFAAVAISDIGRVSAVVLATAGHENKAYDITGPQTLNGDGMAAVLSKVLGYEVKYNDHPGDQFMGVLQGFGFPEWQAKGLVELFDLIKEGKADAASHDIRSITGRHTSFEAWVRLNDGVFGAPMQTTYAFIKPDVVRNGQADLMLSEIKTYGFTIVAQKHITLSLATAEEFYGEHKGKAFFERLVGFMTSGPAVALALRKHNAILDWRAALGPTDTNKAKAEAPESLRAQFGTDGTFNAGHGSDSPASAERELKLIFPELNN